MNFLIFFIAAKKLGTHDFGTYNYLFSIVFMLIVFSDFGIATATSKFVSEYSRKKDKLPPLLFNSMLILLIFNLLLGLFLFLARGYILNDYAQYWPIIMVLSFTISFNALFDGVLRGFEKFQNLLFISLISSATTLPLLFLLINKFGFVGALLTQFIYFSINLAASFYVLRLWIKPSIDKKMMRKMMGYASLIGISNIGLFLYFKIDTLVLGRSNYINEISYFSMANTIISILVIPAIIFSEVTAPKITKIFAARDYGGIKTLIKKYLIMSPLVGLALALVFGLVVTQLINFTLPKYSTKIFFETFYLLLILLPINYFGTVLTNTFIISTNKAKIVSIINPVFGVLNLVLDLVFIHLWGYYGVVYATISLSLFSITLVTAIYKKEIMKELNAQQSV